MYVTKRNLEKELIQFDKITNRINKLKVKQPQLHDSINPALVAQKVIAGMFNGITTTQLDNLAAETAMSMSTIHPDYGILAGRISVSNLHKTINKTFVEVIKILHEANIIRDEVYEYSIKNDELITSLLKKYEYNDYKYDFFGFKTLEKSYLIRYGGEILETPQYMLMRVAIGLWADDTPNIIATYKGLSNRLFIHATPTLFNAGTKCGALASCYLSVIKDDSIIGIYDTLKDCALISKNAGGIGISVSNIRADGSYIKSTNGKSSGIIPMLRVFDTTSCYVDQGGSKRKGSIAVYIEPWHSDILEFLDLKKNNGKEEFRARNLFYALWIPDLFMERVRDDKEWSLFSPNEAPDLYLKYGADFNELYHKYESEGIARRKVRARDLWNSIIKSQIETGTPYMLYKDAVNKKNNQKNLGTIRSSNLCTEVMLYSAPDEIPVCILASISLPAFITSSGIFDYKKFGAIVKQCVFNLNRVIDTTSYPIEEARNSNLKHRPIGIGVQGLADVFFKLHLPYEGLEAKELNKRIFEALYYYALKASCELAQKNGATYSSYQGSPMSEGKFQFDLWEVEVNNDFHDWNSLKNNIKKYGLYNSVLVAPMPTATTSQILENTESFEPTTSNIYTRRVLSGEFIVINKYLVNDLLELNLWGEDMKNKIFRNNGSIAAITEIPEKIRTIYKTVWELSQKTLIDMAADRGPFIDQSQSFNAYFAKPDVQKINTFHFYGWSKGLKTGMYYLRTMAAMDAIKFTIPAEKIDNVCNLEDKESCEMCSS